ncbi:MAG: hypothetical protein HOU81_04390 [Hamadaea sp.]|uniref:LppU/SCO3897 family protein n=1 Tax=Hamadaea sp. TaxID=2024425 RepID=UPI00181F489C|nr:hypothetical protein [Hamadaea sp.]NUR70037.1 hypothetical protein [Hamadaea sp.]NUT19346.1 hypothetical protein [Hamadaea sp.]
MSEPVTYQPAPQPPAQEESRGKQIAKGVGKALLWRLVIGGIVLVIALGFGAYKYLSGNITAKTPAVGECVSEAKTDADVENVTTVDCSDAKAHDKVVGVITNKSESYFKSTQNPCTAYPDAESAYWFGKSASGTILCLVPNKAS